MSGSTSNGNTIGSGSDSIVLKMAEDQAAGVDAQFSVNVDGQQIGGLQTVTAAQSAGQTEAFTFEGNWNPGQHDVVVTFANNFIWPGASGDRNLYVDGVTYNGQTVSNSTTGIYESPFFTPNNPSGTNYGNAVFSVNDTSSAPVSASNATVTPGGVSVGSGNDTLVLKMAEDPYQGDAQFNVSVDGQQVGGTQTTTANVEQGQSQEFDLHGNWGGGSHTVAVTYTNDYTGGFYSSGPEAGGGIDTEDRNLYVMGASLNGGPTAGGPYEQGEDGTYTFSVNAGSGSGSSGMSASDGAPATSSNAAIPAGSATVGSSDSMSFVASSGASGASSDPTGSSASSGSAISAATPDTTSATSGASGAASSDPTTTVAAATGATSQTAQDFTVPATTASSTDTSTTASANTSTTGWSGNGNWAAWHQNGDSGAHAWWHHG